MNDVAAMLLTAGTGQSGISPLNAFDAALHDGGGAALANINLVQVSSIIPPGVTVCRLRKNAMVDAGGLLAHSVVSRADARRDEVVSAGVVAAVPADPSSCGMIFEVHGHMNAAECKAWLEAMAKEGMGLRGTDPGKWKAHTAVATSRPADDQFYRCATAAIVFLDSLAMLQYADAVDPVQ